MVANSIIRPCIGSPRKNEMIGSENPTVNVKQAVTARGPTQKFWRRLPLAAAGQADEYQAWILTPRVARLQGKLKESHPCQTQAPIRRRERVLWDLGWGYLLDESEHLHLSYFPNTPWSQKQRRAAWIACEALTWCRCLTSWCMSSSRATPTVPHYPQATPGSGLSTAEVGMCGPYSGRK